MLVVGMRRLRGEKLATNRAALIRGSDRESCCVDRRIARVLKIQVDSKELSMFAERPGEEFEF